MALHYIFAYKKLTSCLPWSYTAIVVIVGSGKSHPVSYGTSYSPFYGFPQRIFNYRSLIVILVGKDLIPVTQVEKKTGQSG